MADQLEGDGLPYRHLWWKWKTVDTQVQTIVNEATAQVNNYNWPYLGGGRARPLRFVMVGIATKVEFASGNHERLI